MPQMRNDHGQSPAFDLAKIGPALWPREGNRGRNGVHVDQAMVNNVIVAHLTKVLSVKFGFQVRPVRKVPLTVKRLTRVQ